MSGAWITSICYKPREIERSQSEIHILSPVLLAALRTLSNAPARSLMTLAQRLGVSEIDAATVATPLEDKPASLAPVPASPLLCELARKKENPSR